MEGSIRHRKTKKHADWTTAKTVFTGPSRCGAEPVKSTTTSDSAIVKLDLD